VSSIVEAARGVQPVVRAHADEAEEARVLPDVVVSALVDAGLMRLCVPTAYGGPGASPMELVEAIEAVAVADGAAGWCVMIASTTSSMSCFLDPAWAKEIYADPKVVTGGAFAPSGKGVRVEGGSRVSGRWMWGSGTQHCHWIAGGTTVDDGSFHLMFAPRSEVEILDTWYTSGLRGTGSNDFQMTDVFVPDGRSVIPFATRPTVDAGIARFPNFTLLAAGVASTLLGIARHAIDELVALAQGKVPMFSSRTLAQSPHAQVDLAKAEATLGAARAFLLDELAAAWDVACAGDHVPVERRARIRLAATHAAKASAAAVDLAYNAGGGSSVFTSNPLQRCFRDVHTGTQHLQVSERPYETIGRVLFGLESDTSAL
jgi:alkylation response protein AidB-like acyl-CoA dehydrogenase